MEETTTVMLRQKLKEYEGTPVFEMLINLILVAYDGRKGTLLEFSALKDPIISQAMETMIDYYIQILKLFKNRDVAVANRYFVYKNPKTKVPTNDHETAIFLGFTCVGHDYSNGSIPRISGHIIEKTTGHTIYSEVCEISKIDEQTLINHLKTLIDDFNRIIDKLKMVYHFDYTYELLSPWQTYVDSKLYNDKPFVSSNVNTYAYILANEYYGKTLFYRHKNVILDYFELFVFIMDKLYDGTWDSMYNKFTPGSDEYHQFLGLLGYLEQELFNNDPSQYEVVFQKIISENM